jgi:hypothetical protein
MNYAIRPTHISRIRPGDAIEVNGGLRTVCNSDLHRSPFMGLTIFGDSYRCGTALVSLAVIDRAKATGAAS